MGEYTMFQELCTEVRRKYFQQIYDILEQEGLTRCHKLHMDHYDQPDAEKCGDEEFKREAKELKELLYTQLSKKWDTLNLPRELDEVMKKHNVNKEFKFEPRPLPNFDEIFKQWNEAQFQKFENEL